MSKLEELLAAKEKLEAEIEAARAELQAEAFRQIVAICKQHKISYAQLKPVLTRQRKKSA